MVGVLKRALAVACIALPSAASAVAIAPGHELALGLDAGFQQVSSLPPWTEGSVGKLANDSDGPVFERAFVDYSGRLTDTLDVRVAAEGYSDDIGGSLDFTQAFLQWRPVPRSSGRFRLRLGAFYPPLSLESPDPGWNSPYTLNLSAINTWVAEELRTLGVEMSVNRRPSSLGGAHEFSLQVALFTGEDPAGSLLAWKGWSVHERQTRFGDELPLAPLPQLQPGMAFAMQDPYVTPFREVDDRAGFYVGGGWRYARRLELRVLHFENRAEPTAFVSGQYGWRTRFDQLGVQAELPGEVGLVAQWMHGTTVMGPLVGAAHAVDTSFDSWFVLLTREFGDQRLTLRYDDFDVTDRDQVPLDDNTDRGHAWTVSYRYHFSRHIAGAVEWLGIETRRPAWSYSGFPEQDTEKQLQAMFRLTF
jgi:hypothetical protein